ncbi:ornithine cyclodeaminase [Thalassobacillus cyri]|uniref:Ornithine cyclodeaminase n=1 Tax=Thalassobacillus cyri TaxID=571932 RepID=A0A1H3ZAD7_9BACI|nr:cyclodeaminase [Thalassobacillus cyri]SEA20647.1 ornithine cyclodeaminase [Thalassobacillus cyri]
MKLFTKEEIEKVIRLDNRVVAVVEEAFNDLVQKKVQMPPIMRIDVPEHNGEIDIKSAYVAGYDSFAVKLSSGFFDNDKRGLPSASGMMLLLNSETGIPKAVLADNGYLTEVRTAAAGAVAARHLARENIKTVGVIGTGAQARLQVKALKLVRGFDKLLVYGRTPEKTAQYQKDMLQDLDIDVEIVSSPEEVVTESDVVITTTPSTEPLIQAEWFHPGLHITAMGSDAEHKQELESSVLERADYVVCDVKAQSLRLGEMRSCNDQRVIDEAIELGEITAGNKQGRINENQITVCDLTGTGVQDTAIARFAYDRLTE